VDPLGRAIGGDVTPCEPPPEQHHAVRLTRPSDPPFGLERVERGRVHLDHVVRGLGPPPSDPHALVAEAGTPPPDRTRSCPDRQALVAGGIELSR
jgi:hypothetical protein